MEYSYVGSIRARFWFEFLSPLILCGRRTGNGRYLSLTNILKIRTTLLQATLLIQGTQTKNPFVVFTIVDIFPHSENGSLESEQDFLNHQSWRKFRKL